MAYADLQITLEDGTFGIHPPIEFYENDNSPVEVKILDRASSGIIRTAVLNEFKKDHEVYFNNEEVNDNGKTKIGSKKYNFDDAKDAIDAVLARNGVSSDYGLTYEDIYDAIKSTPGSVFRFNTDW